MALADYALVPRNENEKGEIVNPFLVGYVVIVLGAMAIATVQAMFRLDASAWASWVQAIGSVGAIMGSVYTVDRANRHARSQALQLAGEKTRQNLRTAIALGQIAIDLLKRIYRANIPDVPEDIWVVRDVATEKRDLAAAQLALEEISVNAMPSAEAVVALVELRRLTAAAAHANDPFLYRTRSDDDELDTPINELISGLHRAIKALKEVRETKV